MNTYSFGGNPMKHEAMRDPYEVLKVSKTATDEEIRSSYKRLVRGRIPVWHLEGRL